MGSHPCSVTDGDKAAISDAKDILTKKGVTYKNIWFDSKGEAGKFTSGLYTFPTTYVVDKNGNIVGCFSFVPCLAAVSARMKRRSACSNLRLKKSCPVAIIGSVRSIFQL